MDHQQTVDCQRCGTSFVLKVVLPDEATHVYTSCPYCGWLGEELLQEGTGPTTATLLFDASSPEQRDLVGAPHREEVV